MNAEYGNITWLVDHENSSITKHEPFDVYLAKNVTNVLVNMFSVFNPNLTEFLNILTEFPFPAPSLSSLCSNECCLF